jgi:hypothetical protein
VRWFLSNIVSDPSVNASMIAAAGLRPVPPRPPANTIEAAPHDRASELAQTPVIAVSHPSRLASGAPARASAAADTSSRPGAASEKPAVVVASTRAAEPEIAESLNISWEDIAGHSLGEQAKTVLAIVGILAIIVHVLSWLSRERPAGK